MERIDTRPLWILFVFAFGAIGCAGKQPDDKPTGTEDAYNRVVPVRVRTVTSESFTTSIQIAGVVRAYDDILLSPEEGGVVRAWRADKGNFVKKGDTVALLKDDVLRATLHTAEAQYNTAELNAEKQAEVFKEAGISEMQYKSAQFSRDAAKAQVDLARARIDRSILRSPVDGFLDDRFVDEGEMAAPGVPVCRIVNIGSVRIRIDVPERHAGTITRGTPVSFTIMAYPGESFSGKISYIGHTISPDNRTLAVECIVPNSAQKLKPDMIAKCTIRQAIARKTILIDESLVQQLDEKTYVVFVENAGKAEQRVVTLGTRENSKVEILAGLQTGERVVIDGFRNLSTGQKLTVND